jgi:hypothetical protein
MVVVTPDRSVMQVSFVGAKPAQSTDQILLRWALVDGMKCQHQPEAWFPCPGQAPFQPGLLRDGVSGPHLVAVIYGVAVISLVLH